MGKTALDLLEEVAETLTDFVVDESVPQEIRDRLVPTTGAIDEFLADALLADALLEEGDVDYEEDEYGEEGEGEGEDADEEDDDDDYEDDEELAA